MWAGDPMAGADAKEHQFQQGCTGREEIDVREGRTRAFFVRNKTSFPIWVAVKARQSGKWSVGYWRVDPGERRGPLHFYDYRYVYYYAAGRDHKRRWCGEATYETIKGKKLGFRKRDTGTTDKNYTLCLK